MLDPAIKRCRLACAIPKPADGTSFYRAMGPLSAMVREEARLELVLPRSVPEGWDLSWDWLAGCDALFMQRPFLPVHVQCCFLARALGLPIWIDWDDDLSCVPRSSPHWPAFADSEEMRRCQSELVAAADVVSVTTPEFAARLGVGPGAGRVRVIPNACAFAFEHQARERRVSWRGGNSHEEDLSGVAAALGELSRLPQFSGWKWLFMGDVPWQAGAAIPAERLEEDPGSPIHFLVPRLGAYAPFVHIVPLARNAFNRVKSNVAWLEATCAGAVVVAPDWPEWRMPGVVNYEGAADFGRKLRGVMEQFTEGGVLHPGVLAGRQFISEQLMLSQVNRRRWGLINQMLTRGKSEN